MAENWLAALQAAPSVWFNPPNALTTDLPPKVCKLDDAHWTGLMKAPKRR